MDEREDRVSLHEGNETRYAENLANPEAWEANPQSPADDDAFAVRPTVGTQQRKYYNTSDLSAFFVASVALGLLVLTISLSSLQSADEGVSLLLSNREQSDRQVEGFEKDIHLLTNEISALEVAIQRKRSHDNSALQPNNHPGGEIPEDDGEFGALRKKVKSLSVSAEILKAQVQEVSRKEAEQKYGTGDHRVEIRLSFPDGVEGPDAFVIELAPMDLMPHSVHFFLDMVSAGLVEGCSFILNTRHVLKAAPLPYGGKSAAEKARAFTKHGLESVAFKEYSEDFPHKPYTVGFAADGSPSFYINTEDNAEVHKGDPCFGRIVSGFGAVKRLERCETTNGIWFEERIGIKKATILPAVEQQ